MADAISIKVDVDQAKAYVDGRRQALIDVLALRIDATNAAFVQRVQANLSGAVLQQRTGKLYGSVMQEPAQVGGDEVYAAVTAGGDLAPYGIYFEEGGTGYYEIRPVNARVLAFMGSGKIIFAKIVNHPPIPKLPWFAPEVDQATADMKTQIAQAFEEVLNT